MIVFEQGSEGKFYSEYGNMSRLAGQPIAIPDGVIIQMDEGKLTVRGPKGELERNFRKEVVIELADDGITLTTPKTTILSKALCGTYASHIKNMIEGVTSGFEKRLVIEGIGYKVSIEGTTLVFLVGFSHPVKIEIPSGINVIVEKNTVIINGIDKEQVGSFAANVRLIKKPEPYKGKGIRYSDEVVRRKHGKKAIT